MKTYFEVGICPFEKKERILGKFSTEEEARNKMQEVKERELAKHPAGLVTESEDGRLISIYPSQREVVEIFLTKTTDYSPEL